MMATRNLNNQNEQIDGNRIRLARESRSRTQGDLAVEINVSTALVSRWELGLSNPFNELHSLSKALNYPITFFLKREIFVPNILSHQYRKTTSSMSIKDKKTVEATAYIRADHIATIIEKWADFEWSVPRYSAKDATPEQIAKAVRIDLELNRGPIKNLTQTLESRGIFIFLEPFQDSELDGITIQRSGMPPIIFLNSERPGERIRFTLAHEFGHIVMHSTPTINMEEEADKFAAEFLMPEDEIANDFINASLFSISTLKQYWMTSMKALIYRGKSIRAIPEARAKRFYIEMSRNGWNKNEPNPLPLEQPELIKHLINFIHSESGLSYSEISNAIGANEEEFMRFFRLKKQPLKLLKAFVNPIKNAV